MTLTITPSVPNGTVVAPPSKSMAHRLLLAAALSKAPCFVENVDLSKDVQATVDCLRVLGAELTEADGVFTVNGSGLLEDDRPMLLPCGDSGSTLRFLIPLTLLTGRPAVFTGSEALLSRPLEPYRDLCRERGILFDLQPDRLTVMGKLRPGVYELAGNVSSQFVTGLLYALPLLEGPSEIRLTPPVESRAYIKMTLLTLRDFGIRIVSVGEEKFHIPGNQKYRPHRTRVEGDWSNGAFLEALNALGGRVRILGLNGLSPQGDKICLDHFKALQKPRCEDGHHTATAGLAWPAT